MGGGWCAARGCTLRITGGSFGSALVGGAGGWCRSSGGLSLVLNAPKGGWVEIAAVEQAYRQQCRQRRGLCVEGESCSDKQAGAKAVETGGSSECRQSAGLDLTEGEQQGRDVGALVAWAGAQVDALWKMREKDLGGLVGQVRGFILREAAQRFEAEWCAEVQCLARGVGDMEEIGDMDEGLWEQHEVAATEQGQDRGMGAMVDVLESIVNGNYGSEPQLEFSDCK